MKVNEEIYKNMFRPWRKMTGMWFLWRRLFFLNDPSRRRELIMNVLNDNPGEYVEIFKAGANE